MLNFGSTLAEGTEKLIAHAQTMARALLDARDITTLCYVTSG